VLWLLLINGLLVPLGIVWCGLIVGNRYSRGLVILIRDTCVASISVFRIYDGGCWALDRLKTISAFH